MTLPNSNFDRSNNNRRGDADDHNQQEQGPEVFPCSFLCEHCERTHLALAFLPEDLDALDGVLSDHRMLLTDMLNDEVDKNKKHG